MTSMRYKFFFCSFWRVRYRRQGRRRIPWKQELNQQSLSFNYFTHWLLSY